jgi:energy-coupling factor transporter transmembrane protein EcfT
MNAKRLAVILATVLMLIALPTALFGQSCALCYTQAAASTARFIQALRSGILILMLPPFLMSIGITWMTYSRRNHFYEANDSDQRIDNLGVLAESGQDR